MNREIKYHNCKIFVGNVPFICTNEEFAKCFEKMNGYVHAEIINRYNSYISRGFGFVTFATQEDANEALLLKDIVFKDRVLRLSQYDTGNSIKTSENNFIYIKNVSLDITRDDLIHTFSKYDKIKKCFIKSDMKTGISKETAIIEFESDTYIEQLIKKKYVTLDNGNIVEVHKWYPKNIHKFIPQVINTNDLYRTTFHEGNNKYN